MKARTGTWLLMLPGLLWLGLLMVVPCLLIFVLIFFERGVYGGVDWQAPTLENVTRVFDPLYLSIFWDSAVIAGLSTLVALLIGYPAAYAIAKAPASRQTALLFLAILDQLPDPHLCLDRASQSCGPDQYPVDLGRPAERTAHAALHQARRSPGAGLQLHALRHPRYLLRLAAS
jgi:ABC-type cobalt transport system substrate-binding protein